MLLFVACLVIARGVGASCLDDCLRDYPDDPDEYADCVADCGVCGNGEVEGDEACDDGNTAAGDCCDAACQAEPAGSRCADDDELCTTDVCDGDGECEHEEEPAPDCRQPAADGAAVLVLRDADDDAQDSLLWSWRRGAATSKAEFGDPTEATSFAVCLYDASGLVAAVSAPASGSCAGRACWTERANGYRYHDPERDPDGTVRVALQQGRRDGRTKLVVRASGENLDLPDLGSLESPLTVQLRRSGSGLCWSAGFDVPPERADRDVRFRARSAVRRP